MTRRDARTVGTLRIKLCAMLIAAFKAQNIELVLTPDRIQPAQGRNRTDRRMDVYRWEAFGKIVVAGGSPGGISCTIDSWDTVTDCVRYGIGVNCDNGYSFDAYANSPIGAVKVKPQRKVKSQ